MTSNEHLAILTERIAFFLNVGEKSQVWKVKETDGCWGVITGTAKGAQLYIGTAGQRDKQTGLYDRITVSGSFHVGKNNQHVDVYERNASGQGWDKAHVPSITIGLSKGAEKIANDIKRRYLGEYLRILALAVDKAEKDAAFETSRRVMLRTCLSLVGDYNEDRINDNGHGSGYIHRDSYTGHVEFQCSATRIDVKFNDLSIDQTKHIVEYLKRTTPQGNRGAQ